MMDTPPGNFEPGNAQSLLPLIAADRIGRMTRDARFAILVGLIPILGVAYATRLIQWYRLRRRYPVLASRPADTSQGDLYPWTYVNSFRAVLPRFWFAVLFWPLLFFLLFAYLYSGFDSP